MIDSFFPHSTQDRSVASASYGTAISSGRILRAISILSLVPPPTANAAQKPGVLPAPQNLEQLFALLGKQPLQAQVANGQSNTQNGKPIIHLTSALGNLQIQPLTNITLPTGSQIEILADHQNIYLRQLTNTGPSQKTTSPTASQQSPSSFIGKPLQGLVIQSTPLTTPLIAGLKPQETASITPQSLAFIRSIASSNAAPVAKIPASVPLVFTPLSSATSSTIPSVPVFHGIVTQITPANSNPANLQTSKPTATISFFAGTLKVPVQAPLSSAGSKVGDTISFTLTLNSPSGKQTLPQSSSAIFTPSSLTRQTAPNNIASTNPTASQTTTTPPANQPSPSQQAPSQAQAQALTTGTAVTIRIQSFAAALPTNATPVPPDTLSGVLTSQTIVTNGGVVRLHSPLPLPQGTNIQFTVSPQNPQSPNVIPLAQTIAETLETLFPPSPLQNIAPGTIQTLIPQIQSPLMTPALLFLLSALGKGSPENWLGNQLHKTLETRSPKLLKRLQQQFQRSNQASQKSSTNQKNWQWVSLPIADSSALDHILFARYHNNTDSQEENTRNAYAEQRFRIASRFSKLGSFQIEGRIQIDNDPEQPLKKRRFSLMIASENRLDTNLEQEIRQIVTSLGDALHLEYTVIFRESLDPSWFDPN